MPRKSAQITETNGFFVIQVPYSPKLLERIKSLPGRRWDGERKVWTVPSKHADAVTGLANQFRIPLLRQGQMPPDWVPPEQAAQWQKDIEGKLQSLRDEYPAIVVPGMVGKLLPWQEDAVRFAVKHRRALIADDMGVGKTLEALATLAIVGAKRPVIVGPATAKLTWAMEIQRFFPKWRVTVLSGTEKRPETRDYGAPDGEVEVKIINYDILHDWLLELNHVDAIVLDESHKVKSASSRRTKATLALTRQNRPETILLLSGTPIVNYPAEFIPQLTIMGTINEFGGPRSFLWRYCDPYMDGSIFYIDGAKNLDELNYKLRQTCMIRRLKSDVMSSREAPQIEMVTIAFNAKESKAYELAAAKFWDKLEAEESGGEPDFDWSVDVGDMINHEAAVDNSARGELSRLRRKLGELKARAVVEWAQEFLEDTDGHAMSKLERDAPPPRKLVIYAEHHVLVDALTSALKALRVTGRETMTQRQQAVESFQNDPEKRVIIISSSGNENITLTAASDILVAELPWTPKDLTQAIARIDRQGQTRRVAVYELVAADTIENEVLGVLNRKLQVTTKVMDDPTAKSSNKSLTDELMEKFRRQLGKRRPVKVPA